MDDSAKYLIHADITADGVVERSDVVGAVFGQTEGLLGEELDLRDLQQSSKVGRIDVQIDSEAGRSEGTITIASSLDKVETAILAAALETIDRVGPCRSTVQVTEVEDVRAAKRRAVVERAKELLTEAFDEDVMDSREIREEVRASARVAEISEYRGLPAGPRVADADAVIVVEGRADVLTLLRYGIKNAVCVEGTNVPDAVAELTAERTVTAFLDGDRGGELILRELQQVGEVDYVAFAPEGRSVEDLARHEVMSALRDKVPVEDLPEGGPAPGESAASDPADAVPHSSHDETAAAEPGSAAEPVADGATAVEAADTAAESADEGDAEAQSDDEPAPLSLREHVRAVVGDATGQARLLDADLEVQAEVAAAEAFDTLEDAKTSPYALVLDGELSQRVLDVAAQRGVDHVIARETGEFVKKPVDVRVRTAGQLLEQVAAG